jgi:HEAT repeat protein
MRLALAIAVAAACGKGGDEQQPPPAAPREDAGVSLLPERFAIRSVEVKIVDPSNSPARELHPRELAQRLGATLAESDWFLGDGEDVAGRFDARPAVVAVTIGYSEVPEGTDGRPGVIAAVEARVEPRDGRSSLAPAMNVLAEQTYDRADAARVAGILADHVERVVADAAGGLIAKEEIRLGPPDAALRALDAPDLDLRTWALTIIGHRKLTAAFDAVVGKLGSAQSEERDAALGALIALGDRRAVPAIARMADFQDYAGVRRVIDAVAGLGGDEARDYLEFVASGHPDESIRQQAADALRRLERRADREARAGK